MGIHLRGSFRDRIVQILDRIVGDQDGAMDAASDAVARALEANRLVYVAGSGHSHILAEEVYYRAGGIAAAQAVLDPNLMLHTGARRSTLLERVEGYAEVILSDYPIGAGDVIFIASNSGRNAYPIELALVAKERGATTIAITSLEHSRQTTSRHTTGKRLFEVADIVIDNFGVYGDAVVPIPGRSERMAPTSTIAGVFILNAIMAEAVAELAERGIMVDVYKSANMQGQEAAGEAMIKRWQSRIKGL